MSIPIYETVDGKPQQQMKISQHKMTLWDHFTGNIHTKFVQRIGDLNNSELVEGVYINSEELKSIISEAKGYIHVISAETPPEGFKLAMSVSKNGRKFYNT